MFKHFLFALSFLASAVLYAAKDTERFEGVVLTNTQVRKIHSAFTKQNYRILVNIPASYDSAPNRKYPSVFSLDADYSFAIIKNISEHLSDRDKIPETFVFSIAYDGPTNYLLNRTRDYTPTRSFAGGYAKEIQEHSGGGPKFADFIEKELIPYLEKNFRLSTQRTLVGHSYGGLFASWIMVKKPGLFSNTIIVSPSLWYDKKSIFNTEAQFAKTKKALLGRAFFAVGSLENKGDYQMVDDLKRYTAILAQRHYTELTTSMQIFDGESHSTVFPAALGRGLAFCLNQR